MRCSVFGLLFSVIFVFSSFVLGQDGPKNWLAGANPGVGTFENTVSIAYPWAGVDSDGYLRKSVAMPSTNPFITKSNQFSYAWMGLSASLVDMDGDGLPDLVSPDGNGIFWCWKNTGTPGSPAFGCGESMPLLIDDLRSEFLPILGSPTSKSPPKEDLTSSQKAARRWVDEKRSKELDRQLNKNDRLPKGRQESKKDIEKRVYAMFPYDAEDAEEAPVAPGNLALPSAPIPPGGLTCTVNSFRRLRLVASPADWNADKLPDFVVGDSGGTVYFAPNIGRPGQPGFGYSNRLSNSLPLKIARVPGPAGRLPIYQPVEFMNYAMPFVCDWDGNGISDLLVGEGTYSVNAIRLFMDAARATPQNPPKESSLYVGEERTFLAPFAYDWDGDGDLDLFVCDDQGRLTVHRRVGTGALGAGGSELDEPMDAALDGGNKVLAYCTPQPCDWNADGTMDILWGEPFGRIMVALGKSKGGLEFHAAEAIRSTASAKLVKFPANHVGAAAVPARTKNSYGGPVSDGGTASAESFYSTDGSTRENTGGWPSNLNKAFYGLMAPWAASPPPTMEEALGRDSSGKAGKHHSSWAIAPVPGDVWEVIDEPGAPGAGKTFLLRWHDWRENAIFKARPARLPQWTPGASIAFRGGGSGPFCSNYTKDAVTVKFQMKLDGAFSRMDVIFRTNWGPLGSNKKPPAEGGDFSQVMAPPPTGQWFEFSFSQPPDSKFERGLDGSLFIELLGEGEIRIRDVQVLEGK